jgi:cytochrome c oxidase assembly protein subunit 15
MKLRTIINRATLPVVSLITVFAVYFLIAVGGTVRSTGAGMGCPDWPKCFGSWVPPTEEAQLPANYREHYRDLRLKKNERLALTLLKLGFESKAEQILNDPTVAVEQDFNAAKTWIEYVNRLVGVVIGLLIVATFLSSVKYIKTNPKLTIASFGAIVLVVFQAWVGSLVVSTNLLQWMITVHMILALILVMLLIWIYSESTSRFLPFYHISGNMKWLIWILFLATIVQVILGTQVREEVDVVVSQFGKESRNVWVDNLGDVFKVHRSFSILILMLHGLVYFKLKNMLVGEPYMKIVVWVIAGSLLLSVVSGVVMAYFGIPAFAQPIHLLLGTLITGAQFYLMIRMSFFRTNTLNLQLEIKPAL